MTAFKVISKNHRYLHGESHTRLHNIWCTLLQRCNNPNNSKYKNYGGREITLDKEWKIYTNFRDWALSNGYNDNLSIDRIDNNGNYGSSNCRWVDMKTQQRNRRNNRMIQINGVLKCVAEWAEIYKISPQIIWKRINRCGWNDVDAVTVPVETRPHKRSIRCMETGIIYEKCSAASSELGFCKAAVSNAIRKNKKCGGFHWEYV